MVKIGGEYYESGYHPIDMMVNVFSDWWHLLGDEWKVLLMIALFFLGLAIMIAPPVFMGFKVWTEPDSRDKVLWAAGTILYLVVIYYISDLDPMFFVVYICGVKAKHVPHHHSDSYDGDGDDDEYSTGVVHQGGSDHTF